MASPGSSKMEPKLSLSPLPAESELVPIPAKRKRRQLVACDGCRLRRIKCDAADQKDKQGCSECRKKSIK